MVDDEIMTLSRRDWMKSSLALVVVKAGCGNAVDSAPLIAAHVEDDPTEPTTYGTVRLWLPGIADLQRVGGSVTVELAPLTIKRQRPFSPPPRLLVFHRPGDEWVAVDSA